MTDFFKAITSGIARHAFAWTLPSAISVGILVVVVIPSLPQNSLLPTIVDRSSTSLAAAVASLTFSVLIFAVVTGYLSQAAYRLLEGYHLPRRLERRLMRRQLRRWWILRQCAERTGATTARIGLRAESRARYPDRRADVMPTRLGNTLKAGETYSRNRWNFDAISLWYELIAVAPSVLHRELEDARSAMDFFASSIVQFSLLSVLCFGLSWQATNLVPLWVALGALALIPLAYAALIGRVDTYKDAIRALVNVGRGPLAQHFAYVLPTNIDEERFFWANLMEFVTEDDCSAARTIDDYRIGAPPGNPSWRSPMFPERGP